jgi:MFS family permease
MTDEAAAATIARDGSGRRNVLILSIAGALAGSVPPIIFASGALVGSMLLGENKALSTLPVTAFVVGTACGTVPAALLMRRIGRRSGFIAGMGVGAIGCLIEAVAVGVGSFLLLCVGALLAGASAAFYQQFRFAAADTASESFRARAISIVLVGGIAAAVIGPQAVIHFADSIPSAPFAGSFLAGIVLLALAAATLLFLDIPKLPPRQRSAGGRSLREIASRPEFLVAVGCATSAYALMSFVMTAAPLAMVMHDHHRDVAMLGIQWHVIAMFAPSFVTGSLIERFGAHRVVATGLMLLLITAFVALSGTSVGHFWLALILLGVGWNFGFVGGTTLVTQTYRPEEKEKVQALNDFIIFGFVAFASLSAGGTLQLGGWDVVNVIVIPVALACLAALFWQMRPRNPPHVRAQRVP